MKIIALAGGRGWHVQDLARAAALRGHELTAVSWRALSGGVGCGPVARAGQVVLDEADLVLLRTMPPGSLEQVILRMDLMQRLAGAGVRVVNPPRAIETAVDKYLALARLNDAGVPVPATRVCQLAEDALRAFEDLGRDAVVKPIFGSEGFGVMRVTDVDVAARVFDALERTGSVIYLQRYIEHGGSDLRLFVLGPSVLTAMRRRNGGHFVTNIARGGSGEAVRPEAEHVQLAVRAAETCGALIAGVDVLVDGRGQACVVEVNAVPGWRELARVTGIDVAERVLEFLERHGTSAK